MDTLISPTNTTGNLLPPLILDLSLLATSTSSTPSDCCKSALRPSIQLNLPKPRASLLIRDPSHPSLGMRTAIAWRQEQLLAARLRMDERNHARHTAGMIPVTQTTSQILDTALGATAPWSIAMDTTPLIQSWYQHPSHPYLSNLPTRHIKKWPEFTSRTQTPPHWQLKLPGLLMKMTKIPLKYRHPCSSQQTRDLPKGWVYVEDDEAGKSAALRDPNQYGHLPPQLTLAWQQLTQSNPSNRRRGSSTTAERTLSPSPSPTNMESRLWCGSFKFT